MMADIGDEMERKSDICVYHAYNKIWTISIRKTLGYQAKLGTQLDRHTVVALKLYYYWTLSEKAASCILIIYKKRGMVQC